VTTQQTYFSHPSLIIYLFAAPPIKGKLVQQMDGGLTTNSKSLGRIIMMGQSETLSSSQIISITLFFTEVHSVAAAHFIRQPYTELKNHFPEPNQHVLIFLHPIFTLQFNLAHQK
jgi:hypothetical protein